MNIVQNLIHLALAIAEKQAKNTFDPSIRSQIYQAIRDHNKLKRVQSKVDKIESEKYLKKSFTDDFFKFSKSVCNGTFGETSKQVNCDKTIADQYVGPKYATNPEPLNETALKCFPKIPSGKQSVQFNMASIKPKDIRSILKTRSNSFSPGPDGISYAIL